MKTKNVNYPSYTNFGQNQILRLITKERGIMTDLIHLLQNAKAKGPLQFDYYTPVVLEEKPKNYTLVLAKGSDILKNMNEAVSNALNPKNTQEVRDSNKSLFKKLKTQLTQAQENSEIIKVSSTTGLAEKLHKKGFDILM